MKVFYVGFFCDVTLSTVCVPFPVEAIVQGHVDLGGGVGGGAGEGVCRSPQGESLF